LRHPGDGHNVIPCLTWNPSRSHIIPLPLLLRQSQSILDSRFRGNDRLAVVPETSCQGPADIPRPRCRVIARSPPQAGDEAISAWGTRAKRTQRLPRLLLARRGEWLAVQVEAEDQGASTGLKAGHPQFHRQAVGFASLHPPYGLPETRATTGGFLYKRCPPQADRGLRRRLVSGEGCP